MKFEINLDATDLWRFSMYHVNRGLQGIFNLLFTAAAVLCLIFARDQLSGGYIAWRFPCGSRCCSISNPGNRRKPPASGRRCGWNLERSW